LSFLPTIWQTTDAEESMNIRRYVKLLVLALGIYASVAFGKPYFQYMMMYQAFDDAMDMGVNRIEIVKANTGIDMSEEVAQAMQLYFEKRSADLGLPADSLRIDVHLWAGHFRAKVEWEAIVKFASRIYPLRFSIQRERKLPEI
jgi:hypothetical protein